MKKTLLEEKLLLPGVALIIYDFFRHFAALVISFYRTYENN